MKKERFNLSKNVTFSIIEFILNTFIVFFSYKILMVYGGIENVGLWSTLYAVVMLLRVGEAGMASAIQRFIAAKSIVDDLPEIRKIFINGVLCNLCIMITLSFIFMMLSINYIGYVVKSDLYGKDLNTLLVVMFSSFFLFNMANVVFGGLIGVHKLFKKSIISVSCNVMNVFLVFFLVPSMGLVGFALAQLVYYFLMFTMALTVMALELKIKAINLQDVDVVYMKRILSFSLRGYVAATPHNLVESVTKLFLGKIASLEVQGIYEIAYKTVFLTRNVVVSGVLAVMPSITACYSASTEDTRNTVTNVVRKSFKNILILYVVLAIVAPFISLIWLGMFSVEYLVFVSMLILVHIVTGTYSVSYMMPNVTGIFYWNALFGWSGLILMFIIGLVAIKCQPYIDHHIGYLFIAIIGVITAGISAVIHRMNMRDI